MLVDMLVVVDFIETCCFVGFSVQLFLALRDLIKGNFK